MPKKPANHPPIRAGSTRFEVFNSGLEVWLYDEGSMEEIRASGGMDFRATDPKRTFTDLTKAGLVVGYSLYQDDGLDIEVVIGAPLTKEELAPGRWLEPQTAWLRLPTGRLAVESNDASRIGPEEPTDKGKLLKVEPGDYRLTLYRADHEALDHEGIEWKGAQEVIVLTPGGKKKDAADDLLPFVPRRDLTWVGAYEVTGKTASGLAWFSDYWDTFIVNLDSKAIKALGLTPGTYFRTTVPKAGLSLVTVFCNKWEEGRRMPLPDGVSVDEYGYGALSPMADWDGAEALFCRRDKTKSRAEDPIQNLWLPCTVEVLDAKPRAKVEPQAQRSDLRKKAYFDDSYLTVVCSEVIPGADDLDSLPLAEALTKLDALFEEHDLGHLADFSWEQETRGTTWERTARLYAGRDDAIGAIIASEGRFDLFFLSQLQDGGWLVTGMVDDFEREIREGGDKSIKVANMDDALSAIWEAHEERIGATKIQPVGDEVSDRLGMFERFMRGVRG